MIHAAVTLGTSDFHHLSSKCWEICLKSPLISNWAMGQWARDAACLTLGADAGKYCAVAYGVMFHKFKVSFVCICCLRFNVLNNIPEYYIICWLLSPKCVLSKLRHRVLCLHIVPLWTNELIHLLKFFIWSQNQNRTKMFSSLITNNPHKTVTPQAPVKVSARSLALWPWTRTVMYASACHFISCRTSGAQPYSRSAQAQPPSHGFVADPLALPALWSHGQTCEGGDTTATHSKRANRSMGPSAYSLNMSLFSVLLCAVSPTSVADAAQSSWFLSEIQAVAPWSVRSADDHQYCYRCFHSPAEHKRTHTESSLGVNSILLLTKTKQKRGAATSVAQTLGAVTPASVRLWRNWPRDVDTVPTHKEKPRSRFHPGIYIYCSCFCLHAKQNTSASVFASHKGKSFHLCVRDVNHETFYLVCSITVDAFWCISHWVTTVKGLCLHLNQAIVHCLNPFYTKTIAFKV